MSYSNSPLINYVRLSPNNSGRRTHSIDTITIHCVVGQCSVESLGEIFAPLSKKASSNYGVGPDGRIGLYVNECNVSWCTSSTENDNRAVTIEVASDTFEPYAVTDKAYEGMLKLVTDICRRNNIKKLVWSNNKDDRVNHRNGCNMTVHRDYWDKSCPGKYLYDRHGQIAAEVNRRLGLPYTPTVYPSGGLAGVNDGITSYASYKAGYLYDSIGDILYQSTSPYIITLSRSCKFPSISKLKENKVVGCIIEAGYLYDSIHKKVSFRSPKFREYTNLCEKEKFPFGLYMIARAKNTEEAKEEMRLFRECINLHTPKLGAWLQLNLTEIKSKNDLILDRYKYDLIKMGLKNKFGLYVSRNQLNKITWNKHKDDWYLWLVDHVDSTSELNQLLKPEFFKLGGN